MYESHTFIGNLGVDPELRTTPGGHKVVNIRMALNKRYTNADGERIETTRWINLTAWNKAAETIARVVKKGDQFFVVCDEAKAEAFPRNDGSLGASENYRIRDYRFLRNGKSGQETVVEGTEREESEGVPF